MPVTTRAGIKKPDRKNSGLAHAKIDPDSPLRRRNQKRRIHGPDFDSPFHESRMDQVWISGPQAQSRLGSDPMAYRDSVGGSKLTHRPIEFDLTSSSPEIPAAPALYAGTPSRSNNISKPMHMGDTPDTPGPGTPMEISPEIDRMELDLDLELEMMAQQKEVIKAITDKFRKSEEKVGLLQKQNYDLTKQKVDSIKTISEGHQANKVLQKEVNKLTAEKERWTKFRLDTAIKMRPIAMFLTCLLDSFPTHDQNESEDYVQWRNFFKV